MQLVYFITENLHFTKTRKPLGIQIVGTKHDGVKRLCGVILDKFLKQVFGLGATDLEGWLICNNSVQYRNCH